MRGGDLEAALLAGSSAVTQDPLFDAVCRPPPPQGAACTLRLTAVVDIAAGPRRHARRPDRPLQTIKRVQRLFRGPLPASLRSEARRCRWQAWGDR